MSAINHKIKCDNCGEPISDCEWPDCTEAEDHYGGELCDTCAEEEISE